MKLFDTIAPAIIPGILTYNGLFVMIIYIHFPFSLLVVLVSDERSNMFVVAIEENSTKRLALLMEQYRDEMSMYYFLSLCPS